MIEMGTLGQTRLNSRVVVWYQVVQQHLPHVIAYQCVIICVHKPSLAYDMCHPSCGIFFSQPLQPCTWIHSIGNLSIIYRIAEENFSLAMISSSILDIIIVFDQSLSSHKVYMHLIFVTVIIIIDQSSPTIDWTKLCQGDHPSLWIVRRECASYLIL